MPEEYERLPFMKPSELVGVEAIFKRLGKAETKFGPKLFVDIANEEGGDAVATLTFNQGGARETVLEGLTDGDKITFKAIDVGKGYPFIQVVKL